jgi:hypothetical protein
MYSLSIVTGIALVLLTLPGFVLLARREWDRSGAGLFLLSPPCVFYIAYLASFALRPPFQVAGVLQYDFTSVPDSNLFVAQAASMLTWYGFVIAYCLTPAQGVPELLPQRRPAPGDMRLRASAAYGLSIVSSMAFMVSLPTLGSLSLENFGNIRVTYLNSLSGAGHIYLFNLLAGTLLLMGLVFSSFCKRSPRILAIIAWTAYLLPNALVTNRFLVSAVLFALLFVLALKRIRRGKHISLTMVLGGLAVLAAIGAVLGLVRGLSAGLEYAEEHRDPLVFFLWSFDMSEYFQTALQNVQTFDLGRSWFEDLFLQFLPRAVFAWKPQIYGATRLEAEVMPGSIPADGIMNATYPISMFGEAYANFGIPGLLLVGLASGVLLKIVFAGALKAGIVSRRQFWPLLCFCLFVLACANALGYLRSFGWFLSMLMFHCVVAAFCYSVVWTIAQLGSGAIKGAARSAHAGAAHAR